MKFCVVEGGSAAFNNTKFLIYRIHVNLSCRSGLKDRKLGSITLHFWESNESLEKDQVLLLAYMRCGAGIIIRYQRQAGNEEQDKD